MSKEAFIKFCEDVVRKDEALMAQLSAPKNEEEFAQIAVAKGIAAGFAFDASEAIEVMKAANAKRIASELNDAQLDGVAGGFGGGGGAGKVIMQDIHYVSFQDFSYVSSSLVDGI
jgi:hypothetical protein